MTGKDLLLRDKELAKYWASISKDDRFERVVSLACYHIAAGNPAQERMAGANQLAELLLVFADGELSAQPIPKSGLTHIRTTPQHEPKTDEEKK